MIPAALLFLSAVGVSRACVATSVVTTTAPCCAMLSTSTLSRRPPSVSTWQQCSILRRVSSTCPVDGLVLCDAAFDTNPTTMFIEFFDANGNVVRTVSGPPTSLSVRVICVAGIWRVASSAGSSTSVAISSVSCSQNGSTGADRGYVIGSAVSK